jgi:hypothetical protein
MICTVFVHDIHGHVGEEGWVDPDDPGLVPTRRHRVVFQ